MVLALIGAGVVVWRKMAYLRRLTPEAHEVRENWLHDMAPEVVEWFRNVPFKQYQHDLLLEFEKFIRRVRLMFLAVDRLSERLVHKVRRAHIQTAKEVTAQQEQREAKAEERDVEEIDLDDPEQLKAEEQRLIVAIAQNPRDASLYSDLARVYMKMHNFADAVEALAAAVKLEPGNESYQRRLESAKRRLAAV